MKKLIISFAVLAAVLAPAATVNYSDSATLSYPNNLDLPPFQSLTYVQSNNWATTSFTNGGALTLTNVTIPIERGEGIGLSFTIGAQGTTTPSGSNVTVFGDVSYNGGRTFTTTAPITGTITALGTNVPFRPTFYIPYTNTAEAQIFRFTTLSNPAAAGTANHVKFWLTNVVLTTRKANPR